MVFGFSFQKFINREQPAVIKETPSVSGSENIESPSAKLQSVDQITVSPTKKYEKDLMAYQEKLDQLKAKYPDELEIAEAPAREDITYAGPFGSAIHRDSSTFRDYFENTLSKQITEKDHRNLKNYVLAIVNYLMAPIVVERFDSTEKTNSGVTHEEALEEKYKKQKEEAKSTLNARRFWHGLLRKNDLESAELVGASKLRKNPIVEVLKSFRREGSSANLSTPEIQQKIAEQLKRYFADEPQQKLYQTMTTQEKLQLHRRLHEIVRELFENIAYKLETREMEK